MKWNEIKNQFKTIFNRDKKTKWLMILGILSILLILLSEFIPSGNNKKESKDSTISTDVVSEDTYKYKKQIEQELVDMLSQISGVGDVCAMVTIEGTTEYVYAEELNTTKNQDGSEVSEKYENQIVMTQENGDEKALVKQIIKPKISGVVIVCEGGGNIALNERVLKAVSTALNLPTSQICVELKK